MNKLRNKDNRVALGVFEKLSYASGGVGTCMCFMAIGGYLLYVYTDIFHMNAVTAANIFLFTRFWDAVNDPMMGAVVDLRIFAKKGRGVYRPWILIGLPFLLVFFALCFTLPSFITSETGKVIWCVAFYVLYTMAQTVVQVPYGAVTNAITTDTEERGLLGSYRNFGENIGNLLVSISILPMVNLFSKGGSDIAGGYSKAIIVLAVVAGIFIFICYKTINERGVVIDEAPQQKFRLGESLKMLLANRPAMCMVFGLFVAAIIINFRFAYLMYYAQIYMGAGDSTITLLNTAQTAMAIVSFWIVNWMFRKMEKRTMLILCGILFVADGAIFMLGGTGVAINLVGSILFGFLMSLSFSTVWGTIPDSVEYGLWKTGVCAPAFIFAAVTFAQKCGIGLASWLAATSLDTIGYVKGCEITESIRMGFFWWHGGVLVIGGILFLLIALPYNLSKAKYCEIVKAIDHKESH